MRNLGVMVVWYILGDAGFISSTVPSILRIEGPYSGAKINLPGPDTSPEELQVFCHLVATAPVIPWHCSSDLHYEAWVQQWGTAWRDAVSRRDDRPQQSYLSATTYDLVLQKRAYKAYVVGEEAEVRRHLLMKALGAFWLHAHALTATDAMRNRLILFRGGLHVSIARATHQLQALARQVKRAVRTDRLQYRGISYPGHALRSAQSS